MCFYVAKRVYIQLRDVMKRIIVRIARDVPNAAAIDD